MLERVLIYHVGRIIQMKLTSFSVTNYRSITTAHKIKLDDLTVLVGKNNEGKSNILKALALSMTQIIRHHNSSRARNLKFSRYDDNAYNWERDFPVSLQSRTTNVESIFKLDFSLDTAEAIEFKKETGIYVNGDIPIDIRIGKDNITKITVPKRGSSSFNQQSKKVAEFVSERSAFINIPAVRTEEITLNAINEILSKELSVIEENPDFINSIETINRLQNEILETIALKIKEPLSEFMPSINDIKIKVSTEARRFSLRKDFDVIVDDGTPTNIEHKGDGVKSLAALAMLKDKHFIKAASIIAIEEPEVHLHPSAIHQLMEVIIGLAVTNQVILTTHNPLFVSRNNLRSNIIVDRGNAAPAKNIREIRNVLGVMPSDNLINSNCVLVVEGEDDKISLLKLLSVMSEKIKKALANNILVIEEIGGAGNLSYKLNMLRNFLCKYHVFMDHDKAGTSAAEKASKDGLLTTKYLTYTICNGMGESEFEDCLNSEVYKNAIVSNFGVDITSTSFRGNKKWSERMKETFLSQGKPWNDETEKKVKQVVADSVLPNVDSSLNQHKRSSIDALVTAVENLLS